MDSVEIGVLFQSVVEELVGRRSVGNIELCGSKTRDC